MKRSAYDKMLRSNWFLSVLLLVGAGCILTMAYHPAESNLMVMGVLLIAITIGFAITVALL